MFSEKFQDFSKYFCFHVQIWWKHLVFPQNTFFSRKCSSEYVDCTLTALQKSYVESWKNFPLEVRKRCRSKNVSEKVFIVQAINWNRRVLFKQPSIKPFAGVTIFSLTIKNWKENNFHKKKNCFPETRSSGHVKCSFGNPAMAFSQNFSISLRQTPAITQKKRNVSNTIKNFIRVERSTRQVKVSVDIVFKFVWEVSIEFCFKIQNWWRFVCFSKITCFPENFPLKTLKGTETTLVNDLLRELNFFYTRDPKDGIV